MVRGPFANQKKEANIRGGIFSHVVCAFFLILVAPQMALGGAWTAKKGGMYNKLALNLFWADESFGTGGGKEDMANNGEFTDYNLTYYGEYGLVDRLTILGSIPLKRIRVRDDDSATETTGVGDIDLGFKIRFLEKPFVFSIQSLVKIPPEYDENSRLPLGNGQLDLEFRLLIGKSLWPLPMYFGLEGGIRFRAEEPSDELRYLVEVGGNVTKSFYLRTKLDGTESLKNSDIVSSISGSPVTTLEFDLAKLELTAGYSFKKSLGGEFTLTLPLFGENTAAGFNLQFAVVYGF